MQASVPAYAHTLFATCCWMECEHLMGHGVKKSVIVRQPSVCAGHNGFRVIRASSHVRLVGYRSSTRGDALFTLHVQSDTH